MREFIPKQEMESFSPEDPQLEQRFEELSNAFELGEFSEAVRQVREGRALYLDRGGTSEAYLTIHNDQEVVVRLPYRYGTAYDLKTFKEAIVERTTALIIGENIEDLEKPLAVNLEKELVFSEYMPGRSLSALAMDEAAEISYAHFERAFIAVEEATQQDLIFDVGTLKNVVVDEQRFGFLDYGCASTAYLLRKDPYERAVSESRMFLNLLHSAALQDISRAEDPHAARDAWQACLTRGLVMYAEHFPNESGLVMQLEDFYQATLKDY